MGRYILPPDLPFDRAPEVTWLTTADVARTLGVTKNGARWLVRTGQLACERTRSGQRLFRAGELLRVAAARARTRLTRIRGPRLHLEPEPQQLPLFRRNDHFTKVKRNVADVSMESPGRDKGSSVNPWPVGPRRLAKAEVDGARGARTQAADRRRA